MRRDRYYWAATLVDGALRPTRLVGYARLGDAQRAARNYKRTYPTHEVYVVTRENRADAPLLTVETITAP